MKEKGFGGSYRTSLPMSLSRKSHRSVLHCRYDTNTFPLSFCHHHDNAGLTSSGKFTKFEGSLGINTSSKSTTSEDYQYVGVARAHAVDNITATATVVSQDSSQQQQHALHLYKEVHTALMVLTLVPTL